MAKSLEQQLDMAGNVCRVGDIAVVVLGGGRRAAKLSLARIVRLTAKGFTVRTCSYYTDWQRNEQGDLVYNIDGRLVQDPAGPKWHLNSNDKNVNAAKVLRITMHSLPQSAFEIFDNMEIDGK